MNKLSGLTGRAKPGFSVYQADTYQTFKVNAHVHSVDQNNTFDHYFASEAKARAFTSCETQCAGSHRQGFTAKRRIATILHIFASLASEHLRTSAVFHMFPKDVSQVPIPL